MYDTFDAVAPPVAGLPEIEYVRFLGSVADRVSLPVAVQNAPGYLGVSLSNAGLRELSRQHPNVCLLKGEGPAVVIRRLIEDTQGVFRVLNGRGGLELPDNLRAGCAGIIPAIDCFDALVEVHAAFTRGDERAADAAYARVLPIIVFVMQSLETLLTCPLHTPVTVARVTDQDAAFLRFIESHHLKPGQTIEVEERDEVSDSVRLKGRNDQRMTIGARAASKLLVKT